MTQDYKNTLLKYLTGNLSQETGSNVPQLGEPIASDSLLGYQLDGYNIIDIIQGYQSSYSVIYGNDTNHKGFLAIIDENYNLVQLITQYSSGTQFGEFQVLNVDEEGKFYGIDINNGTPRFIMLNNITLLAPNQSSFIVNLRQSYNLPSPLSTASSYFAITKAVGQGKYLMGATTTSSSINSPLVTELTINVGATNDWVDYQYTETSDSFIGQSMWASWDEDNIDFKVCGYTARTSNPYYIEYTPNGSSLQKKEKSIPAPNGYSTGTYEIDTIIQNKNVSYISSCGNTQYGLQDVTTYLYARNQLIYIMAQTGTSISYIEVPKRMQLKVANDTTYFLSKLYIGGTTGNLNLTVGRLTYDPVTNSAYIGYKVILARADTSEYVFYITNYFNLYNYNIIGLDFSSSTVGSKNYLVQEVYNINNYNGLPYENVNSLIPNSAILYDNNNLMVFARNLYNKSVYSNTTLSVVQIPNTMVNDISIAMKNLIGQTNKILVSDTENLTKNIYETLYLNYYNTLLIQNRNTEDYITNQIASDALNLSVSQNTDYDAKKAIKYRINYSDDTNKVFNINPNITIGEEITTTGNNVLTIENAKQGNAISYIVDGVTVQDGTPTPSDPIDIETIHGDSNNLLKIKVENEDQTQSNIVTIDLTKPNLFNKNNYVSILGHISNNVLSSNGGNLTLMIPVEPNTTYALQKISSTRFRVGTSSTEASLGSYNSTYKSYNLNTSINLDNQVGNLTNNATSMIYTTNSTAKYLYFEYYVSNETSTYTDIINSIIIYKSDNITPYYELDYKDTLSIDDNGNVVINKKIGKRIFNGSESDWAKQSSTALDKFSISINNAQVESSLSSHFEYTTTINQIGKFWFSNDGSIIVFGYSSLNTTTLSQFKTWLSNNNVLVYYVLATPQTITLSNTTLPLYEGINHITLVDDLETNTSITYDTVSKATYNIVVCVPSDKLIETIDIISNDETVRYQTISGLSTLENNQVYGINQDCYVE